MKVIALIFSCSIAMSSTQSSQFPNMESTEFPDMESSLFPDIPSTEVPYLESSDFPNYGSTLSGLVCDYYKSVSCNNPNNYGTTTGSIDSFETVCILFSNPVEQDVTFSTCPSNFDTQLNVANERGEKISTSVCNGGDGMIPYVMYVGKI